MLRVLQFADIINRADFIDTIIQHADRQQFQIHACVRSTQTNIASPVFRAPTRCAAIAGTGRKHLPRAAWKLARLLREWEIDILHAHHYDQAVIGWLATQIHRKTRLIVGRHYSDAIYRLPGGLKQGALLRLEKKINRAARRIIVPSSLILEILSRWQGINPEKIDLIPYGFEPEKYLRPTPEQIAMIGAELGLQGRLVIGNFSRLHEEKGHRFLLDAIASIRAEIPDLLVLLIGEGPERNAIEEQIARQGLGDSVRLLGWRRDAMTIMAAVDIVAQSTLQEAFSQVMAEALWMGKPLIMTRVSGAADVIRDGENGLLVQPGDSVELAQAIRRLAKDSGLQARLARAGRTYVEENLVIDKIIPHFEQAYLRAMEER